MEHLARRVYTVGTIQTSRIGYAEKVIDKRKKKPKDEQKGALLLAKHKTAKAMTALSWMDSKPVSFLATGASTKMVTVGTHMYYFHTVYFSYYCTCLACL
ncbi:hypothetical protein PI125_g23550 [Phytophthora idaei]|nr:hypothetical protein PI125_g23550 [Phytophthora idaei]